VPTRVDNYPAQAHDTNNLDCWCGPDFKVLCDEHDGDAGLAAGCWKCGGSGLVVISKEDAIATDETVVIVHQP